MCKWKLKWYDHGIDIGAKEGPTNNEIPLGTLSCDDLAHMIEMLTVDLPRKRLPLTESNTKF